MSKRTWIWIALVAVVVAAQLVPVSRENPPVETELVAEEPVRGLLRRACYDCHSHETKWPWYAYVAPVSWLVAHDVEEAREHLNFSTWNRYSAEDQLDLLEEMAEEVTEREMPLQIYLSLHSEARITTAERKQIADWAEGLRAATSTPPAAP